MSHKYIRAEIAAVYGCGFSSHWHGTGFGESKFRTPDIFPVPAAEIEEKTLQEMSFHAGCCDMIAIIKTKCSFLPYYCSFSLIV